MSNKSSRKIPLFVQGAFDALRSAVSKTIEEHRRSGDPIVIWRNGKVVLVPARRLLGRKAIHPKAA